MKNEIFGMIFSIIGMAITAASFQAKKKKNLLLLQTAGNLFYLASYFFAEAGVAFVLNVLYVARNLIFYKLDDKGDKANKPVSYTFIGLFIASFICYQVVIGAEMWWNIWNLLPLIGAIFGTVAVMQTNVNRLRLWKYGDSLCWLLFNGHLGLACLGGIIGEVINLISLTLGMLRFKTKKVSEK